MALTEREVVARSVLDGFARADAKYRKMSSGWSLHAAPEYYATVGIAGRIAKSDYVTLEQNVNDAVGWSGGTRFEGKADSLPAEGRFDIAVWRDGDVGIKGVVEVKLGSWFTYENVGGDVRRVCDALGQAKRIEWGMSAFHFACWTEVSKPGAERVRERMENIVRRAGEYAEDQDLRCEAFFGERTEVEDWNGLDGGCAGGAVLVFERV